MTDDSFKSKFRRLIDGDSDLHIEVKRRKMKIILISGIVLTLISAMVSLCIGQTRSFPPSMR